ncbi:reverse transcriptase domain-containing protein [Streptomyces sp. NBC_01278]
MFWTSCGKHAKRLWVLDADLSAAFDRIDHGHLMSSLGLFPARELVREWLTAGVIDRGRFAPTEEGTPQGGVNQSTAAERCSARTGKGCWVPVSSGPSRA